jgi:hypothetical protein
MKHLEYINESAAAVIKLEKYCEDNLQYLLDIGYKIIVFEEPYFPIIKLLLKKDSQYPIFKKIENGQILCMM